MKRPSWPDVRDAADALAVLVVVLITAAAILSVYGERWVHALVR